VNGNIREQKRGKGKGMKKLLSLLIGSSLCLGCATWDKVFIGAWELSHKIPQSEQPSTPTTTSTTTTTTIPPVISEDKNEDAIDYSKIIWHGQNKADKAVITKVLRSVEIRGDMHVKLDYDTNADWVDCKVIPGCKSSFIVAVEIDGVFHASHIDHMKSGAKTRDLGNLYSGYAIENVPRGKDLYVAIASHDGRWRSNIVKAIRK
jgi:hypothetical protein